MANWIVYVYDEDLLIDSWMIHDRTEHEADKEAEADVRTMGSHLTYTLQALTDTGKVVTLLKAANNQHEQL